MCSIQTCSFSTDIYDRKNVQTDEEKWNYFWRCSKLGTLVSRKPFSTKVGNGVSMKSDIVNMLNLCRKNHEVVIEEQWMLLSLIKGRSKMLILIKLATFFRFSVIIYSTRQRGIFKCLIIILFNEYYSKYYYFRIDK